MEAEDYDMWCARCESGFYAYEGYDEIDGEVVCHECLDELDADDPYWVAREAEDRQASTEGAK